MRRRLAVAGVVVAVLAAWMPIRSVLRGFRGTEGARVDRFALQSALLHRKLHEILVLPPRHSRTLLVFLHGRSSKPGDLLRDSFFKALKRLGSRAPAVLLADGGDHSYWHDRRGGRWGSYVLREAIPAAARRAGTARVAIGGISMGGFGALDLARLAPGRFCAVGGHSAALWFRGADTPAGAFDDAEDFTRNDVIRAARSAPPYRVPVWLDVGTADPFREADTALARELRSGGARVTFHLWPGGHDSRYWQSHWGAYFRFYASECG